MSHELQGGAANVNSHAIKAAYLRLQCASKLLELLEAFGSALPSLSAVQQARAALDEHMRKESEAVTRALEVAVQDNDLAKCNRYLQHVEQLCVSDAASRQEQHKSALRKHKAVLVKRAVAHVEALKKAGGAKDHGAMIEHLRGVQVMLDHVGFVRHEVQPKVAGYLREYSKQQGHQVVGMLGMKLEKDGTGEARRVLEEYPLFQRARNRETTAEERSTVEEMREETRRYNDKGAL